MPTKPTTEPSDLLQNLRSQANMYFKKYGGGMPPEIGKFVANMGLNDQLDQMLISQIPKGPITDWAEFAEPLYAPYRVKR